MRQIISASAAAIVMLLVPLGPLSAQPPPSDQSPKAAPSSPDDDDRSTWMEWREWMRDRMMGDGDWGSGEMMGRGPGMMWGGGMPMHSGMMPMMMMAMVDTDGNGSISYEEVDAVHRRMFNLVDKDKNGQLSAEEIQAVMGRSSGKRDD